MDQPIKFKEDVSISKQWAKTEKIGGKEIPYINVWGKKNQPHPPTSMQKFIHNAGRGMSNKLTKLAGLDSDIISDRMNMGTHDLIVEKYKELDYYQGYSKQFKDSDGVIQDLSRRGYNRYQIENKIGLGRIYEIHHSHGLPILKLNTMLNEGIDIIWDLVAKHNPTDYFTNSLARIGTGTSTASAFATQTGLLANAVYKAMDATYPLTSTSKRIDFKGTFGTGDANQAWEEFSVDNGATPNDNLMRAVTSKGTKSAGETWTLEIRITGS